LASIGVGASTGAACITVALIVFRTAGPAEAIIPVGLFVGVVAAVATAWVLSRPIADYFRRGVAAAIGAFAALLLAGLAVPADMVAGVFGLSLYLALLIALCVWAWLKARMAGGA
jgi:hypothetical protein